MTITKLPNGNLAMTASVRDCQTINTLRKQASSELAAEAIYISEVMAGYAEEQGMKIEQVAPEEVGALTSAPLISDGENVYGYMAYQVSNFLEELLAGKEIIWQKG